MSGAHRSLTPRRLVQAGLVGLLLGVGVTLAGQGVQAAVRPDHPAEKQLTAPTPASRGMQPAASAVAVDCLNAVRQADATLREATRVEKALYEHTEVMNQLSADKITPRQALTMGMPSLINGAHYSAVFDTAYSDYRAVVKRCKLS